MNKSPSQKRGKGSTSKDKKSQPKHTSGKQERKKLTEDEAKALGLKKLPCCGKYGTHKPEDCRSSKTNVSQVISAESKPKSKKDTVASIAAKGVSFYDNDDEFNLVLLHQPRQSDPIPVESESVGPAVVPVQSAPVVAVSVPMATSRNDQYAIAPNIHVTERVLENLMDRWDYLESAAAQRPTHVSANADNDDDGPPPLVPDSDDDSDDEAQPREPRVSTNSISDGDKKRDPRSQFYVVRSPPARQTRETPVAETRSTLAAHQPQRLIVQPHRSAQRPSPRQPTSVTTHVTPVISTVIREDIVLYLDTGASSNAVPSNSPIIHDVHDIPTREIIGVGQEDCTQAGVLQHFGPALIVPSLSIHINEDMISTSTMFAIASVSVGEEMSTSLLTDPMVYTATAMFVLQRMFISNWIDLSMVDTILPSSNAEPQLDKHFIAQLVILIFSISDLH